MENIKKMILIPIPMSICNLRCHYCYLSQRDECFQGKQPNFKYSPKEFAFALRPERIGGKAFVNMCADGETLLTKDIESYIEELLKIGHYVEVVTNLTITKVLDKLLSLDKELLKRLEFKCSFHYLELKKKNLLEEFANNVNKIWKAGASACVETAPSDELIPYIEEFKDFSIKHFGALPQLTIIRDDRTEEIIRLSNLSKKDYDKTWGQFNSNFWEYKNSVFGVKQTSFCYAGKWSVCVRLDSGIATGCYFGPYFGDIIANPYSKFPNKPIGKCPIAHCYNAHAFLTLGLIKNSTNVCYGDIRNRIKNDGSQWLQPEILSFFNTKLQDNNEVWPPLKEKAYLCKLSCIEKLSTLKHKLIK